MPAEVMVRYTLADIYVVTLISWRRLMVRFALFFGGLIFGLFAIFSFLDGVSFSEISAWFPWAFYGWLFLFVIVFTFGVAPVISYLRSKRRGYLGPHRLRLQDDGVHVESPQGLSTVYWSAIPQCVVSQNRLLLYMRPVSAVMLPKRDFTDQSSFEDAVNYAKARWLDARVSSKT